MIRKASRYIDLAAVVHAGGNSNKQKPSTYFHIPYNSPHASQGRQDRIIANRSFIGPGAWKHITAIPGQRIDLPQYLHGLFR